MFKGLLSTELLLCLKTLEPPIILEVCYHHLVILDLFNNSPPTASTM
jgi:hypothetical protein